MYGNSINNPFIMSNMSSPMMSGVSMMRGAPMMNNMMRSAPIMAGASRGGLGSLLGLGRGGGLLSGARGINFASILNNASKALGVVNQAIPIVKEVGPMMGNMKQMLKIASIFKDETDTSTRSNTKTTSETSKQNTTNTKENDTNINSITTNSISNENTPNFFL